MNALRLLLHKDRALAAAGVVALAAVAWCYLWQGAGMGMSALDMTSAALFPHRDVGMEGSMPDGWALVISMWWVMMVAMMAPSVLPLVLLFLKVLESHAMPARALQLRAGLLLGGYFAVWLVFSVVATAIQKWLESAELISEMMLWSRSALLSAAVLAVAGLYQFSTLKHTCLAQCRSPVQFLTRHAGTTAGSAFTLGLRHGAFCVGCCWLLMSLLFVGGVMNVLWIAALTVLVLVERLAPAGVKAGRITGVILLAWSAATLLV